jgi:hypothetical protein
MNHTEHINIIEGLIGQPCERSLSCNSIKIRFGCSENPKGTSYIWIDAPWEFQTFDKLVTESYDCPNHEETDYESKFLKWSDNLKPLNHTVLIGVSYTEEKELELEFEGGYYIYVPYSPENLEEEWYEHWYAKAS